MNYLRAEGETINVTISMFLGYNSSKDQNASGTLNLFTKKYSVLLEKTIEELAWNAIERKIFFKAVSGFLKIFKSYVV